MRRSDREITDKMINIRFTSMGQKQGENMNLAN